MKLKLFLLWYLFSCFSFQILKSQNINVNHGDVVNLLNKAEALANTNLDSSWYYFSRAERLISIEDRSEEVGKFHKIKGILLRNDNRRVEAIDAYLQAAKIFDELGRSRELIHCYSGIAYLYQLERLFENLKEYAEMMIALSETINYRQGVADGLHFLGTYYFYDKAFELSRKYFLRSYSINGGLKRNSSQLSNVQGAYRAFVQLRDSFPDNRDYADSVNEMLRLSLELQGPRSSQITRVNTYLILASNFIDNGRLDSAKTYMTQLDTMFQSFKGLDFKLNYYDLSSRLYELTGDFKKALAFKILHYDSATTHIDAKKTLELQELEEQYVRDKKVLAANSQRDLFVFIGTGLLLILVFIYFWFQNKLQKRKLENIQAVLKSQEDERKRIARDLHDSLGMMLTAAQRQFEIASLEGNSETSEAFTKANNIMTDANTEVRKVAHSMMSISLERFGLKEALEDLFQEIESSTEISINRSYHLEFDLSKEDQREVFRVVQELVNNTIKHAGASEITFELNTASKQCTMSFQDNGKGFDLNKKGLGIGFKNIYSRTDILKGKLKVQSKLGEGSIFHLVFPPGKAKPSDLQPATLSAS